MKIAIGSDHAGFRYKEMLKQRLIADGHQVGDLGTCSPEPVDYPKFIRPVAEAVARGEYDRGIVLGGSGNGEAIVANRVHGVPLHAVLERRVRASGPRPQRFELPLDGRADGQRIGCAGDSGNVADDSLRGWPSSGPHRSDRRMKARLDEAVVVAMRAGERIVEMSHGAIKRCSLGCRSNLGPQPGIIRAAMSVCA